MDKIRFSPYFLLGCAVLVAICLPLGVTGNLDGENMKRVRSDRGSVPSRIGGIGFTADSCIATENDESEVVTITGFLFFRTERIGTKSEGPEYYLRTDDGTEIHIFKKATLWQEDPALHKLVERKVSISGELMGSELFYTAVEPLTE